MSKGEDVWEYTERKRRLESKEESGCRKGMVIYGSIDKTKNKNGVEAKSPDVEHDQGHEKAQEIL